MRDSSFDFMKGIGIIAMIAGHSHIPHIIESFIFAWHMPLFFIISGYFYNIIDSKTMFVKNWHGLLVPYLITASFLVSVGYMRDCMRDNDNEYSLSNAILSIIVASGSKGNPTFLADYSIGAIWFLLAMFWCRTSYNYLQNIFTNNFKALGGGVVAISLISIVIGNYILIPTNILQGTGAMMYFLVGHYCHKFDLLKFKYSPLLFLLTIFMLSISTYLGALSIVRNYYSCFIINFPASVLAFFSLYKISNLCVKHKLAGGDMLCTLGKISILILCVHLIDITFNSSPNKFVTLLNIKHLDFIINPCCRIIIACSVAFVLRKIHIIRVFFNLR